MAFLPLRFPPSLCPDSRAGNQFQDGYSRSLRTQFAHPRVAVEEEIRKWHEVEPKSAEAPRAPFPKREFKPADRPYPPKQTFSANRFPRMKAEIDKEEDRMISDKTKL